MDTWKTITPNLAIGGQPTETDLKLLKDAGYVAVVNLRNPGEPDQPLDPEAEGRVARAIGLDYIHSGIGGPAISREGVEAVSEFLDRHAEGKVLIHCRSGGRAAAVLLLREARNRGWATDAVAKGRALGLEVGGALKVMVEQYLAENAKH